MRRSLTNRITLNESAMAMQRDRLALGGEADHSDEALAARVAALGFEGEAARVVDLLPLVHVAWSDGAIQKGERAAIIGLLRVMFDPRITLQQQVSEQLKTHFGPKVFDTIIPRNVRLAEAPSYGVPGVVFDPGSKGAQAFVEFAHEMVRRLDSM